MTVTEATRQREEALALANHVRMALADYKRNIRALSYRDGHHAVANLLAGTPQAPLCSLKVGDLVGSIRRLGRGTAYKSLRSAGIYSPELRLRELTTRQRIALAHELRERIL